MSIITPPLKSLPPYRRATYVTGAILIGLGLMLLLSQYLQATWIAVMLIPILGFVLLYLGLLFKRFGLMISGSPAHSFAWVCALFVLPCACSILCFSWGWVSGCLCWFGAFFAIFLA